MTTFLTLLVALPVVAAHSAAPTIPQLDRSDLTVLGVTIGTTTLDEVRREFGTAKDLRIKGDESGATELCYVSPTDGIRVVFESGPMGSWETVTGIAVYADGGSAPDCTPSDRVSRAARTTRISLGQSENTLDEFGAFEIRGQRRFYTFDRSIDDEWSQTEGMYVEIRDGKIAQFSVFSFVSN